jgi:hypothetical protein
MGFADDIRAFKDKALKQASDNTNKIVEDLFLAAVRFSPSPSNPGPYATGLLVNQWYSSISSPDLSVTGATSPTGTDSISRIMALKVGNPFLGKDNVVFLTNSTEEAQYADMFGWAKGAGTNGWVWSGKPAYYMRSKAISYIQGTYT